MTSRAAQRAVASVLVTCALSGCSSLREVDEQADSMSQILADQATMPLQEEPEAVALVTSSAELNREWERFRFDGAPPNINFNDHFGVLAATGESSSCPLSVPDARLGETPNVLILESSALGGPDCTADFNPRAFLLAIERSKLPGEVTAVQWLTP